MMIDLENVGVVVLKPSTSTSPGATTGDGRAVATHEVRTHSVTCIADPYEFHQVPDDVQPVLTVLGNTQEAHIDSIPGPAKISVNSIDLVDTVMTQLDTINSGYRQTLSTFTTVINGITRVCHPN